MTPLPAWYALSAPHLAIRHDANWTYVFDSLEGAGNALGFVLSFSNGMIERLLLFVVFLLVILPTAVLRDRPLAYYGYVAHFGLSLSLLRWQVALWSRARSWRRHALEWRHDLCA